MALKVVALAAIAILGLGILLHIVGLATPEWETASGLDLTVGLWEACQNDDCRDLDDFPGGVADWLEACRALALLGMIAGLISAVADIVLVVFSLAGRDGSVVLINVVSLASAVASCVMIIMCIIIYAAKSETSGFDFGYSFALSIVGGILILFGGILAFRGNKE